MRHLVIMLKEPRPGRVKTRLAKDMGVIDATWWFRHQTQRLISRMSGDRRWQVVLAVAPDPATMGARVWPAHLPRIGQGGGDLGARMTRVFRAMPPGPVVIIGGDIPGVTPTHIWAAFEALGSRASVLGPASDGGFWLIGLKHAGARCPSGLLDDVRWSHRQTLNDTRARLERFGAVALTDMLDDVDTLEDLHRLRSRAPALF
jgi:rSAM/selenodomain-associated transferase 1